MLLRLIPSAAVASLWEAEEQSEVSEPVKFSYPHVVTFETWLPLVKAKMQDPQARQEAQVAEEQPSLECSSANSAM